MTVYYNYGMSMYLFSHRAKLDCAQTDLYYLVFDHRIRSDRSSIDDNCTDWLETNFGDHGRSVETWGNLNDFDSLVKFRDGLEKEILVEFHSNGRRRDCGFFIYTMCFNHNFFPFKLVKGEECFNPRPAFLGRKRRSTEDVTGEIFSRMVMYYYYEIYNSTLTE